MLGLTGAGMAGSVPGGAGGALWAGRAGLAIYGEPVAMECCCLLQSCAY